MSSLTHYLLIANWMERKIKELGDVTSIQAVNVLLKEEEAGPFEEMGHISIRAIYTLTGNYLPPATVKEAIEAVPWFSPKTVQLFHRSEHDERFTEVPLDITMRVALDILYTGQVKSDGTLIGEWEPEIEQSIKPFGKRE